ncbi:dienelactone hydrolase [Herbaspirillum sp. Sphag1AN]|uniref:dienelactone hydrolase family protein n=1 Tax=unclassified Herbaspirillum TaxID=2624150 RepID=UPI0016071A37|nr:MULTISPECIES: dienelactone hydrolase family protein [unclassified Herbaspirillum]MBB3211430.1 dienelactone hydrolase [Herbaspirillum sp. Sphag1AN]MBB3245303.1 dienelactone hydrolase [Herbaspirillum sp. Sphag64]
MKTRAHAIAALCLFLLSGTVIAQSKQPKLPPLHTERVSLTSEEGASSKATALFGFWFKGKGKTPDKKATIIAMHGCGGLYSSVGKEDILFTPRYLGMARTLTDAGYNVLFPDSFTPRGRRSICQESQQQRIASSELRREDLAAALRWVATQDDVDTSRIAFLGWSHGATTILSGMNIATPEVAVRKIQPKAAVAFYPVCTAYSKEKTLYKPVAPMLILMGEDDDWAPPQDCQALAHKLEGSDTELILKLYPETYHDFDAPGLPLHVRMDIPGVGKRGEGVTIGGNAESRAEAYQEMMKFLKSKLN